MGHDWKDLRCPGARRHQAEGFIPQPIPLQLGRGELAVQQFVEDGPMTGILVGRILTMSNGLHLPR
jgi:hypothetical protein